MIIGITGVFGSGKTIVAKLFGSYGYKIINADKIGHELLNKKEIKGKIIKEFNKQVLTKNKIDRKKLKKIVFYNSNKLKKLNKIIHPFIIKEIKNRIKYYKTNKIVVDAALLIEAKALDLVDKLIVVKINRKEQLRRILKKRKYNKKEITNIIRSQLSQKEKLKYADIIVDNSKGLKNTQKQVEKIIKELK